MSLLTRRVSGLPEGRFAKKIRFIFYSTSNEKLSSYRSIVLYIYFSTLYFVLCTGHCVSRRLWNHTKSKYRCRTSCQRHRSRMKSARQIRWAGKNISRTKKRMRGIRFRSFYTITGSRLCCVRDTIPLSNLTAHRSVDDHLRRVYLCQ